jgi:hypothetical protein
MYFAKRNWPGAAVVNPKFVDAFKLLSRETVASHQAYAKLADLATKAPADSKARKEYDALVAEVRREMLRIGAPGQLFAADVLKDVRPLKEVEAHAKSKPIGENSKVEIERAAHQERHDAIVRNIAKTEDKLVVIELGGAHELRESMKRLVADAEYVRVRLKTDPDRASGSGGN